MNGSDFSRLCLDFGLQVTEGGIVKDDVNDYCLLRPNLVQLPGNEMRTYMLDAIQNISYMDAMHTLTLYLIDGTSVELKDSKFTESDTAALMGMSAMPTCILELDAVMPALFPGIDDLLYFDVLNEQMAFYPSFLTGQPHTEDEKPILFDDNYVPEYLFTVQKRLRDLGFTGKRYPSKEICIDTLKRRAWNKQRNLFKEWLETLKWDGTPRLKRWFIDGLGVTAPPLEEYGKDQKYLEAATEAWFLGAVSRQYQPTKVEIVPVLIGGEGIGKGNFLRYTAGYRDEWFIDTSATLKGVGAEQKFLDGIRGRIIVELSESVQFSTKEDVELLKTFVSKTEDQSRKPYAMFSTSCPRRFSLIATSNQNNIFLDTGGGNRRYFPMYCNPDRAILPYDPKFKKIGRTTMEQVWAEAVHIFKTNPYAGSFMTKELAELAAIMQEYSTRENTAVTTIDDWLDDPMHGYDEIGSRVSKKIILTQIFGIDPSVGIPKQVAYTYQNWMNIQKCWRKVTSPMRIGNEVTRSGYERIYTKEDLKEKRRSNMVNVLPGHESEFVDVVGIIRKRAKIYRFSKEGDRFPTDGLTSEEIDALCKQGYIYLDSINTYCLAMMP